MRALLIGLRTLAREWRSGDLLVLFGALVIAVAALTGVGFLVDRVNRAIALTASEVLAADLRLTSPQPIDAEHRALAERLGLRTSSITSLLSVVLHDEASQLANVHAVNVGYPLRGAVKVSDAAFGDPRNVQEIPARGEVWPDSRLATALEVKPGDEVQVGTSTLRVARILLSRPDQGAGLVDLAPSMLMNESDIPATGLVQPGSRVQFVGLYAGDPAQVREFRARLDGARRPDERLREIADASPQLGTANERAGRFLSLASLASVILCATAVALTARRYLQRHLDIVALLKTLGASQRFVFVAIVSQLLAIAVAATILGGALGYVAHAWLLRALKGLVPADLPAASAWPLLLGLGTAVLVLLGFALPVVMQLSRVPALRILRRDTGPPRIGVLLAYGPAAVALAVLIAWVLDDRRLALWFVVALAATLLVLALAGLALVRFVGSLRGRVGIAWRYGLANLSRRRAESVAQIVAFGLGLSAMLLLAVIRGDLIEQWRASLPQSTPNFFFINIPTEERDAFATFLAAEQATSTRLLPMVRARMTRLNGVDVSELPPAMREDNFAQREQNLSWSEDLGEGNEITAGRWFTPEDYGKPLVSVATDFQERLAIALGDRLTFDIAGETLEVTVTSFRRVQWDSLRPNFFLMFAPGLLDGAAGTWLTSAYLPSVRADLVTRLVRRFPMVSVFDMDDLLAQLRGLIDKAVLAVQSVFVFTLFAGLTVLLAAVQATRDERRFESAMLRTLGARRATVLSGLAVEFGAIGLLAGVLAAAVASLGGFLLATRVLDIPYRPNPALWAAGIAAGTMLVTGAGLLATRAAVARPPLATLRQG